MTRHLAASLLLWVALPASAAVPPQADVLFQPGPVSAGGVSQLRIVLRNTNGVLAFSGLAVANNYPAGLVNAAVPAASTSCADGVLDGGAPGGSDIRLSGATLAPDSECVVTVNVSAAADGRYTTVTTAPTAANAGSGDPASATLLVYRAPMVQLAFSPGTVNAGDPAELRFTLGNANADTLVDVGLVYTHPPGLNNAASPVVVAQTCGGVLTAPPGGSGLSLSGATIPAESSCELRIRAVAASNGTYLASVPAGALTAQGGLASSQAAGATLQVIAIQPPQVGKTFGPPLIQNNGSSTLRLRLYNPNTTARLLDVAVDDVYPADLINGTPAEAALRCDAGSSGTLTGGAEGGDRVGFTGGSLAPGAECVVSIRVTSKKPGSYPNSTSVVSSSNGGAGNSASATLEVSTGRKPPNIDKVFIEDVVGVGSVSRLVFRIDNPGTGGLNGVSFSDTYPAGLVNAPIPAVSNDCDGDPNNGAANTTGGVAGGDTIGLAASGNNLAGGASCTVGVNVVATAPGTYDNVTSPVTSQNGGDGNSASDTLVARLPGVVLQFELNAIASGGQSILRVRLDNTTEVDFTQTAFDLLLTGTPGQLSVAGAPVFNSCGGMLQDGQGGAVDASDTRIVLAGGTVTRLSGCVVEVPVTAAVPGRYTLTLPAGALSSSGGGNAEPVSAELYVTAPPQVTQAFAPASVGVGGLSVLTVTLLNPNPVALSAVAFTDTLPAGLSLAGAPSSSCGGSLVSSSGSFSLNGGVVPGGTPGRCRVSVLVASSAAGDFTHLIPAGGLSSSGGSNAAPASAVLAVRERPLVDKQFDPAVILAGDDSLLVLTLQNPNAAALSGIRLSDVYPPALVNATPLVSGGSCAGISLNASAGGSGFELLDATLPGGGSCTVSLAVTGRITGSHSNTTSGALSTQTPDAPGAPSNTALLAVNTPLTLVKSTSVLTDPLNGSVNPKRVPGALVEYALLLTNTGVRPVTDVLIVLPVPPQASYVPGSIVVDGVPEDDDASGADETDPDGADFGQTTANAVTLRLPQIAAGASVRVVFRARLD